MDMEHKAIGLENLAPVGIGDAEIFLSTAEEAQVKAWLYYFPLLHFYGQFRAHLLLWELYAGSIIVYQIRQREGRSRMDLYLLPFPFDPAALRHAQLRMQEFNGDRLGRIVWVQESHVLQVARAGFDIFFKEEEFIYDRAAVVGLEGTRFKKLRNKISGALCQGQVETRPYTSADKIACFTVLEAWRERLIHCGIAPNGYRYTRSCLKAAKHFPLSILKGIVAEVDGQVRGFAFTGPITHTLGCNFLCITDISCRGLFHLLCYRLMAEFSSLTHFNDSSDTGRLGLRAAKKLFRPVEMHSLFGARER